MPRDELLNIPCLPYSPVHLPLRENVSSLFVGIHLLYLFLQLEMQTEKKERSTSSQWQRASRGQKVL